MSDFHDNQGDRNNTPPLQTVVQLNVYRQAGAVFEYLLLRRIDNDSKFWQVITEPVHSSATLGDTLRRAASEQAGLRGFKHLSHEMYSYEWYTNGERGRDIVFAAEISPETPISIDYHQFEEYAWMTIDDALQHLKWNGNRTALRKLNDHLQETKTTDSPSAPSNQGQDQSQGGTPSSPYGTNVPKRLPDAPDSVAAPVREVNPGEFFL